MLDNPWNAPPRPNADDPSPRYVRPIPSRDLYRIFDGDPVTDDRPDLYRALNDNRRPHGTGFAISLLFGITVAVCFALIVSGAL